MHATQTGTVLDEEVASGALLAGMYQVVLFNDDHNSMEYVVLVLMKVFGHTAELAAKIMFEAHRNNRAIAEVEEQESALRHKQQLESAGLTAAVEPV